jgi:hypothetical protein
VSTASSLEGVNLGLPRSLYQSNRKELQARIRQTSWGSWEKRAASRDVAQPAYPKFQTPTLFFYRLQTNNVLKACNLIRRRRRTPPDLHQRSSRVDPTVTSETIPLCTVRLKINNRMFPRLMIECWVTSGGRHHQKELVSQPTSHI